jgi:hypothetical protein
MKNMWLIIYRRNTATLQESATKHGNILYRLILGQIILLLLSFFKLLRSLGGFACLLLVTTYLIWLGKMFASHSRSLSFCISLPLRIIISLSGQSQETFSIKIYTKHIWSVRSEVITSINISFAFSDHLRYFLYLSND